MYVIKSDPYSSPAFLNPRGKEFTLDVIIKIVRFDPQFILKKIGNRRTDKNRLASYAT